MNGGSSAGWVIGGVVVLGILIFATRSKAAPAPALPPGPGPVDKCAKVSCPSPQVCDPATGLCVAAMPEPLPSLCTNVTCPAGQACDPVDGKCKYSTPPVSPPPVVTLPPPPEQQLVSIEGSAFITTDSHKVSAVANEITSYGLSTKGLDAWVTSAGTMDTATKTFYENAVKSVNKVPPDPLAAARAAGWLAAHDQPQAAINLFAMTIAVLPFPLSVKYAVIREAAEQGTSLGASDDGSLVGIAAAMDEVWAFGKTSTAEVLNSVAYLKTLPSTKTRNAEGKLDLSTHLGVAGLLKYVQELPTIVSYVPNIQHAINLGQVATLNSISQSLSVIAPQTSAQLALLASVPTTTDMRALVGQVRQLAEEGVT